VLGLLDHELLDQLLPPRQIAVVGAGGCGRTGFQLGQHLLDLVVVMAKHIEHVWRRCSPVCP
jgi:hypothetical protein